MLELFRLDESHDFPSVDLALDEPNGLLAFGGDLSPQRLIKAYQAGIFPWFSEGEPLLWWSPDPRGIILVDDYQASKSLRKSIRKFGYTASMNKAFSAVIERCANVKRGNIKVAGGEHENSTWITQDMLYAYQQLHRLSYAHSIEIWNDAGELVGGLYGIAINGAFCGESMFHTQTDASKAAFWALVQHMRAHSLRFIDCQMVNPHLETLGCFEMPRSDFIKRWQQSCQIAVASNCWSAKNLGWTE